MYTVCDLVRSTNSADGAIILDLRQGHMFNLNLVAARIFQLLQNGLAEGQIVEEISRDFVVSRDVAAADVREFVQVLIANRLVEEHPTDN